MNYPLATNSWGKEEMDAMQRVIASGHFTMGKEVAEFERASAQYFGSKHCIMVNSGSSANLLMVAAMRYRKESPLLRGDEILVPAVSWATTYYPLHQYGLKLRFVDIDKDTFNYDLRALEAAITRETKAIMVVHLLGNPNDMTAITAVANKYDLIVLEDNCESMGASFNAKRLGTFGQMGTMSTFFSHHMSTMEGGLILTDDEELYQILLCLRAHGWTRNLPKDNLITSPKSEVAFEESFRFVLPGYNVRPLELSGAIGQEQLKKLPSFVMQRRRNATYFKMRTCGIPWISLQQETGLSSWFGFGVVLAEDAPISRSALIAKLTEAGIETRPIVGGNFVKNEVVQYFDYTVAGALPNAEAIDSRGFFVGNCEKDLTEQIDSFAAVLKTC